MERAGNLPLVGFLTLKPFPLIEKFDCPMFLCFPPGETVNFGSVVGGGGGVCYVRSLNQAAPAPLPGALQNGGPQLSEPFCPFPPKKKDPILHQQADTKPKKDKDLFVTLG
jgi:hypothetical protein